MHYDLLQLNSCLRSNLLMTLSRLMVAAVCSAAISLPHSAFAQGTGGTPSARTWDFALTGSRASEPFDGFGYVGVMSQYAVARNRWWWLGAQAGVLGQLTRATACDLSPNGRCFTPLGSMAYVAPLTGVGVRRGPVGARAMAGPRVTVNSSSPLSGAQIGGELSIGNERAALYLPITWSRHRHNEQAMVLLSYGFGLQLR